MLALGFGFITLCETLHNARCLPVCAISFLTLFCHLVYLRCECWWRTPCAIHNFMLFDLDSRIVQHFEICRSTLLTALCALVLPFLWFIDNWTIKLSGNGDSEYFSTTEATKMNVISKRKKGSSPLNTVFYLQVRWQVWALRNRSSNLDTETIKVCQTHP